MSLSLRSPFVAVDGAGFSVVFAAVCASSNDVVDFSRRISLRTLSRLCLLPLTSSAKSDVSLMLIVFFGMTFARSDGEGECERAGGV